MLFVFVGEKIDVTPIPYKPGDFNNGVKAKCKILQTIYGNYNKDIIEFEAYDHYSTPKCVEYKTVLLFVSKYEGRSINLAVASFTCRTFMIMQRQTHLTN